MPNPEWQIFSTISQTFCFIVLLKLSYPTHCCKHAVLPLPFSQCILLFQDFSPFVHRNPFHRTYRQSFKMWFMVVFKHLSLAVWSSSYIIILGYKTLNTSGKQTFCNLCFYIIFQTEGSIFFLASLLIEKLNKAPNDLDVKIPCYSSAWWSLRPWYWKKQSHLLKHESSLSFLGRLHRTVN